MENFQKALSNCTPELRNYAIRLTQNEAEAEDLFQETALKLLTKADQFQEGTNYKAWAYTIMRNSFLNEYRRKNRINKNIPKVSRQSGTIVNEVPTDINEGSNNIRFEELYSLVRNLPIHQRIPFQMKFEGYKYREIAEVLSVSINTLKSRVHHARQRLQREYEVLFHTPLAR